MMNVTENSGVLLSSNLTPSTNDEAAADYDYYSGNGNGNYTIPEDCPSFTDEDIQLIDGLAYWVEGVIQTTLAITGLLFNIISREIFALDRFLAGNLKFSRIYFLFIFKRKCFVSKTRRS